MPPLPRATDLDLRDQITLLSGADVWHTAAVPGVPGVRMNDGPHGMRVQLDDSDHLGLNTSEPATCFPTAVTLASSWDEDLLARVGAAVAEEARALGVSLVLGPGLNIKRHPLGGRNFEYLSEDPLVSGRMAAALVDGIQSVGVGACVKHFAVNNAEYHRFVSDSVVDERTLREIYLAGFEHVITRARPWAVMASYNLLNGVQVTEDDHLLQRVLREEWGYAGLVVSDWGATGDRVAGVRAGMDLEMPGGHGLSDHEVAAAVASGDLTEQQASRSAQRVLDLVATAPDLVPDAAALDALGPSHDALAREAAAAGAVLLRNDGILPLPRAAGSDATGTTPDLAVIGAFAETPRYQGSGSSLVNARVVTSLRQELDRQQVLHAYAPGYDPISAEDEALDEALVEEAVAVARAARTAVVVVGLPGVLESEGFDRDHLRLPRQHDALVSAVAAANPRTVVLLCHGSPVLMPWRDEVSAVLTCHLGGQAGGAAMVDLLFGDAEPGGRLAETFPARLADVASDGWFPGPGRPEVPGAGPRQVQYREGLLVGHRRADLEGPEPLWAFGHGLGWSRTQWSEIRTDRVEVEVGAGVVVTVLVTNPSARATSEVVQVYRADRRGVVPQPARQLAGFAKVHLAPGESREVAVEVAPRAFEHWDTAARGWRTAPGPVLLEVARSSVEVLATIPLQCRGDLSGPYEVASAVPRLTVAGTEEEFAARCGRSLPDVRPVRPFTRNSTIAEIATTQVGFGVRELVLGQAPLDGTTDPATRLMIQRSLEELPLRAVATFSGGMLDWPAIDSLLEELNAEPE